MPDFQYVTKAEAKPVKEELYAIIHEVQDIVRDDFTFQFRPVGSASRNMITRDLKSNVGFDFDFDLEINDEGENYGPEQIHHIIKNAIDKVAPRYGYKHCEDSTRVLTIRKVNIFTCQILHSCDFALVYNCANGRKQYIRFNKKKNNYTWEFQGNSFNNFNQRFKWLQLNGYLEELKKYYIKKKNQNKNPNKHSRSILAESVNELYQKVKC